MLILIKLLGTSFGVGLVALLLWLPQGVIVINQPAANMKPAVMRFRNEFVNDYRATRSPIPVFSLMAKAGMTPVNVADESRFGKTAEGKPRVVAFSEDGTRVISEGNAATGVTYPLLLNDKKSTVSIDLPRRISADVEVNDAADHSLKISLTEPLAFHLKGSELGLPVPKDLYLQSIFLSDSVLEYQFTSKPNGGLTYKLKLDLTKAST